MSVLKRHSSLLLIVVLVLLGYANTFHVDWQFDDKPNIINNTKLHIEDLSPGTLWQTFFAMPGREKFYRPLANLSFALNWYVGGDNPFGYHLVNTAIHVASAVILYFAVVFLLKTPAINTRYQSREIQFIALLASVLWAVNPIQTQAVTYIVQRMASLAGMFYILSILLYLMARLDRTRTIFLLGGSALSFVLALMSKENAALLPASLVLIEIIFFQNVKTLAAFVRRYRVPLLLAAVVFGAAATAYVLSIGYGERPFTMAQRLMTEPRILLFYLSQIFYPLPDRLSITHDVVVSTSLLTPWMTLPAMLTIVALVVLAVFKLWQRPMFSLAVLFFFLNHLIESSFIPLELIFEHRNYIPSFFLFLPLAVGISALLRTFRRRNRFIYFSLWLLVVGVVMGLTGFTFQRNQTWRTQLSLWEDAMQKAPRDARPVCNLAIQLAWGGDPSPLKYDAALALFKRALELNTARDFLKQEIVANIGNIYFEKGAFREALPYYHQALAMNPLFLKARYNLLGALIMLGQWEDASLQADLLIDNPKGFVKADYFNRKGFVLLWQDQPEAALVHFEKALELGPPNPAAVWLNAGVASSLSGRYQEAEAMFQKAFDTSPADIRLHFAMIENSVRAGKAGDTAAHLERLLATFDLQTVVGGIHALSDNFRTAPLDAGMIRPVLVQKLMQLSVDIESLH